MMVEDVPESSSTVHDRSPHFPLFREFKGASYLKLYDIFCRTLVQEQPYTTASIIALPRAAAQTGDYKELSDMTSLKTLVTSFAGHAATEAAR